MYYRLHNKNRGCALLQVSWYETQLFCPAQVPLTIHLVSIHLDFHHRILLWASNLNTWKLCQNHITFKPQEIMNLALFWHGSCKQCAGSLRTGSLSFELWNTTKLPANQVRNLNYWSKEKLHDFCKDQGFFFNIILCIFFFSYQHNMWRIKREVKFPPFQVWATTGFS